MGGINVGRVVLGGLLAGLVINASEYVLNEVVLGPEMRATMERLNLPQIGGSAIAVFVVFGFVLGIATIWLYAAIRPRYGAGPKTALCAGATTWFFAYFYPTVGLVVVGVVPRRVAAIAVVWGLVELLVAAVVGAWPYQEGSKTAARI